MRKARAEEAQAAAFSTRAEALRARACDGVTQGDETAIDLDALRQGELGPLTDRQFAVCVLIAHGFTGPQIAEKMGISEKTVASHRKSAWGILSVHSIPEFCAEYGDDFKKVPDEFRKVPLDTELPARGEARRLP